MGSGHAILFGCVRFGNYFLGQVAWHFLVVGKIGTEQAPVAGHGLKVIGVGQDL